MPSAFTSEYVAAAVATVKSRISFVRDLWDQAHFYFVAPTEYNPKDVRKRWKEGMAQHMTTLVQMLPTLDLNNPEAAEAVVMEWIEKGELHKGNVMNAFRLAIVGECKGPNMFDITKLLGCDETVKRLQRAIDNIQPAEA